MPTDHSGMYRRFHRELPRPGCLHRHLAVAGMLGGLLLTGCTGISVEPSCPTELVVGDSGTLKANEKDEGAVPKYEWKVLPETAGTIAEPTEPSTTFTAKAAGKATFRLTARDGLYQVISECSTRIITLASIAVTLEASPGEPVAGDTVTLTCSTETIIQKGTRTIEQVDADSDDSVELTQVAEGTETFITTEPGDFIFRCVVASGVGDEAEQVESEILTITVAPSSDSNDQPDGDADDTGNGNDNADDVDDDGDPDNANDNGSDPPVRPPVRR